MSDLDRRYAEIVKEQEQYRRSQVKAEIGTALDSVVAALIGVEFLGQSRRAALGLMLSRVRIAVEESL